jgi:hypothetical protein
MRCQVSTGIEVDCQASLASEHFGERRDRSSVVMPVFAGGRSVQGKFKNN